MYCVLVVTDAVRTTKAAFACLCDAAACDGAGNNIVKAHQKASQQQAKRQAAEQELEDEGGPADSSDGDGDGTDNRQAVN